MNSNKISFLNNLLVLAFIGSMSYVFFTNPAW